MFPTDCVIFSNFNVSYKVEKKISLNLEES